MTRHATFTHEFVEYVPEHVEDGKIYVSIRYATSVHRCACGCGIEVATPLSPADWQLTFDGETVTLFPSIGNWGLPCRSHYWIKQNRVEWARPWSAERIAAGRAHDRTLMEQRFGSPGSAMTRDGAPQATQQKLTRTTLWQRFLKLFK